MCNYSGNRLYTRAFLVYFMYTSDYGFRFFFMWKVMFYFCRHNSYVIFKDWIELNWTCTEPTVAPFKKRGTFRRVVLSLAMYFLFKYSLAKSHLALIVHQTDDERINNSYKWNEIKRFLWHKLLQRIIAITIQTSEL